MLALDLGGTFAFALGGAAAAIRRELDLFGVLVLSFAAATAGGITRDVLIGAAPPAALRDWRYVAVAVVAGLVVFLSHPMRGRARVIERLRLPIQVLDAAGLSLFAVAGTLKALALGLGPVGASLIGTLTAVGGGVARDVLVAEIPVVLRSELYAIAALAGAIVVVAGRRMGFAADAVMYAGMLLCFAIRVAAVWRGWRLPTARASADRPGS